MLSRRGLRISVGTSLVEALVALAVMAFGMLAVLGLQGTLRMNSDIAKQRSEAVRIAQEQMERLRAFTSIDTVAGQTAYADLVTTSVVLADPEDGTRNTQYTLSWDVIPRTGPERKEMRVSVAWVDRNGEAQNIVLQSIIGANDPRVSRTLGARPDGIPVRLPQGRHPAIPVGARDMQDGTSAFKPPGAGGAVLWVFDNLSGVIVGVCNTVVTGQDALTQADTQACAASTTGLGVQLSGLVRFSTGLTQPTAADSENPTSTALNLAVALELLPRTGEATPTHACYADAPNTALTTRTAVPYFCAIFFQPPVVPPPADPQCPPKRFPCWSGISTLTRLPFLFDLPLDYEPWALADNADDPRSSRYRVCRYTPATSDAQIPNQLHPRNYTNVGIVEPLTNQNFLVIRAGAFANAGDDTQPFVCPSDGPINPTAGDLVNSNTLVHPPPP